MPGLHCTAALSRRLLFIQARYRRPVYNSPSSQLADLRVGLGQHTVRPAFRSLLGLRPPLTLKGLADLFASA